MNLDVNFTPAKHSHRVFASAIVASLLLLLPSCGIPKLRCPQPGAPLPNSYNLAPAWTRGESFGDTAIFGGNAGMSGGYGAANGNNDAPSPSDKATDANDEAAGSAEEVAKPDEPTTSSKSRSGFFKFASFTKPVSSPESSQADNPDSNVSESDKAADSSAEDAPSSKSLMDRLKLISFVKPASSLDLKEAQDANASTSSGSDGVASEEIPNGLGNGPLGTGTDGSDLEISVNGPENSAQLAWSEFFNDPFLTNLISQAITGNQELQILAEEIQIASNEVLARRGEYLPFVHFWGGAGLEKSTRFSHWGAVEDSLEAAPGVAFPDPLPDFMLATNITWEVDIWRKLRNARDAAALRYLGTADGRNYVVTRLVAEVADKYYELLALDGQLATLDATIAIQEQSLETAQALKEAARGTELAVQRFQAEVRKNQSEKLIIQQQIVQAENRINFLLGRYPQPVDRPPVDFIDLNLNTLSSGVPAQLLRNRPDIRQAERELQASGLDVRVARARFYPSLGINAGVGYRAFNPRYLFTSPESLIYNVAGDLVAPLLNRRAIRADYLTANAKQLQAVYEYQRTILNAFTEVINYMAKVENFRQSIDIKKQQLASLTASVDSATKLFQNARGEYLDVLLAQRDMMEARMVLIETKQQQLSAVINTYQALGGGRF
jgi:multidrug efflux system outer membrane protein